jgi:RNA polymerase sigma factor (sigma-70 family)
MMKVCARYTINEDEAVESLNAGFLKVLQNLEGLRDLSSIGGWVKQIAVRTAIDFYRSKRRYSERNRLTLDADESPHANQYGLPDFTESKMDSREIFRAIQTLPDTTREVLNLFAIDGFSHREIAQQLDISEEASRWHLHKARRLMTEKLQHMTTLKKQRTV